MNKNYLLVSVLFLMQVIGVSAQDNIDPSQSADESTRLYSGDPSFEDFDKAFSGPNNTTNFPSETLFSLSDIGRKTYHMYRSTNYRLTRLANYQPLVAATVTNEALSSPMLKITGSSITVDLNGFHLERQTTDVDGLTTVNAVGIEIGYSPYDAANNKFGLTGTPTFATVAQPENVTIRNGRIGEFGIGIVIHAGVKNVTLENLTISNAALGVVCAGQSDKPAVSIFLKNVRIEGDGTDKSAVLSWAKSKLEGSTVNVGYMNYGDGTLMPEQVSPVGAEGTTLNVYSGILLVNTNNVSVYDVGCTNLGYARCVDVGSAAEGTASATFGINAIGCTSLQLEKIDASNNASLRLVSGINISGCNAVTMTDVVATNNHIVVDSAGALTPTSNFGLWARGVSIDNSEAVTINGLEVSRTLGASSVGGGAAANTSTAMGLYLDTIKVLNAQNVQSDYNDSQLATAGLTFGVYTTGLDSGVYENISASSNTGDASANIAAGGPTVGNNGSVVGMYFSGTCKDVQLKDVSCNTNNSSSQYSGVYGLSFASTGTFETISFENVSASNNTQTHNSADQAVAGIRFGATITNLTMKNVNADKNTKTNAGSAYGIYTAALTTVVLDGVTCDNNTGVVSVDGMFINGAAQNIDIKNSSCSVNTGTSGRVIRGLRFGSTATNVTIQNSSFDGNDGSSSNFNAGIYFASTAINVVIADCSVSNTTATSGSVAALWFAQAITNVKLHRVKADRTNGNGTTYGLVTGSTTAALEIKDCSFDSTTSSGSASYGLYFTNTVTNLHVDGLSVHNISGTGTTYCLEFVNTLTDSQINNLSAGTVTGAAVHNTLAVTNLTCDGIDIQNITGAAAYGWLVDNAAVTNLKMKNVYIAGVTGGATVASGLHFTGTVDGFILEDGTFLNMNTTGTGEAYAINFASTASNVQMERADVMHVASTGTGDVKALHFFGAATGVTLIDVDVIGTSGTTAAGGDNQVGGIHFDNTADNVMLDDVHANGSTGSTAAIFGFKIDLAASNIIIKNSSFDNTNASGAGTVYGIWIPTSVSNLTMENVTANYTHGTTATTVYGMLIDDASGVNAKNISANNTSGVFARGIAFTSSLSSAYIDGLQANSTTSTTATDTTNNLRIEAGDGVTLKNVQCNGLANDSGEHAAYSIDFVTSAQNIVLENVEANNNTNNSESMHGIIITAGNTVSLKNVSASGNVSTDDSAYGIIFSPTASNISMDSVDANNNDGNVNAVGIYFATLDIGSLKNVTTNNNGNASVSTAAIGIYCAGDANNVTLENVVASGNYGSAPTSGAGGILFADTDTNAGFVFKNVVASNNTVTGTTAGTYAFGIKLGSANSLVAQDINCSYNVGPNATQSTNVVTVGLWNTVSSVGMWLVNPVAAQLSNVTCDYNALGSNTAQAYVFGLLLDNPSSVTIDSISCSNNAGNALGAGLFAKSGSSVSVTNGLFNNNTSVTALVDVTTNASPSVGVNMSKHTATPVLDVDGTPVFDNPQLLKGSYGIVMDGTGNVTLDTVTASQNSGFRAFGVQLRSCNGVQMKDCITNQQSATGALFVDGTTIGGYAETVLDDGTNGSAVVVPGAVTVPDIFGSEVSVADTVDLQLLMSDFLDTVKLLKDAPDNPEIIWNVNTMYGYHKPFVETSMLIRAIVAQVRAWGVAVGTQLNNCSDAVITNLIACGNNSVKDSAFGLIFANNCQDCKVYGGQFNNNEAWAESALGYTFADTIDIRAMNQFWSALDVDMLHFDGAGYVTSGDGDYGKLATTDLNADGRFTVTLADASTPELCNPCGPMAAGIVIGDTTERVDILDVTCAGNQANAGQAYGLMHDVSVGASVQNSRFFQNMSNTCGIAFGLADFTPQSLSVHLGNSAFGNQYHLFMDSNYIVPFNPGEPYNMEFPVKVGYNGNITELANASVYDNVEIRFVYHAPEDATNLPDGVFDDWVAEGYTETPA